jgi:phosphoenolpyruvate carboxykinase (ATP)
MTTTIPGRNSLAEHGIAARGEILWRPSTSLLYSHALRRGEARLAEGGPLVVDTGRHTGRSPRDKYIVREPGSESRIWWGDANAEISEEGFEKLRAKVAARLAEGDVYVVDAFAGADPEHRIAVRVVSESPWHALFAKTLFIDPAEEELTSFQPQALVLHTPSVSAVPDEDGTRSETFICLHPTRMEVVIGGTYYAGEIKKSIFTVMNDRLPLEGVFPMHCSANLGPKDKVAVFFGLSGTGKTTLSADPERHLIGDDEHGWSTHGVFNFEGGCYAKVIRLSEEAEPQIYATTRTFGTVLENVVMDEHGVLDLDDDSKTENTRDQAMYWFLSGFTAKLAGTEIGVTEPQPTFSACFGAPFLPQPPSVYAHMLGDRLHMHPHVNVWLLNTGWTGGPFGQGSRMPINATRRLLNAALTGELDGVEYRVDEVFGIEVPLEVHGVDSTLLDPRSTWADPEAYDVKARELAQMFVDNFVRFPDVAPAVAAAGPRI